jgi:hypothetical protein
MLQPDRQRNGKALIFATEPKKTAPLPSLFSSCKQSSKPGQHKLTRGYPVDTSYSAIMFCGEAKLEEGRNSVANTHMAHLPKRL